jgi:4-hydroxy-tetrahydrodipicolinate synthase
LTSPEGRDSLGYLEIPTMNRIGLNCALSTPFGVDGAVDYRRLVAHARWVLDQGADGITLFGTTGEGASLGIGDRYAMFGALAGSGFDTKNQVIAGVSSASEADCLAQCRAAYDMDCKALLLAPPFYFSGVGDDALFRFFAGLFEKLGASLRDVFLYHIPGMTRVPLSVELTRRLANAYPGVITGVKDSAGDWAMTARRLAELSDLQILVGDERQLARAVAAGGAGSICGLANVAPDLLLPLANEGHDDARVHAMVEAILRFPFMPAIKALIAARLDDPDWRIMRAPLDALDEADARSLAADIAGIRRDRAA